jgi:hypothetical protein
MAKAWPLDEKYQVLNKVLMRGLYLHLSFRVARSFAPSGKSSYI